MTAARPEVADARRVVIKLGTNVVTDDEGRIARERVAALAEIIAHLTARKRQVLVVSSGAVGLGARMLGLGEVPRDLEDRQACAAVGQSGLVGVYSEELGRRSLVAGQVLLTEGDFDDRDRYLNLRGALLALLRRGVVPVINENDVVSTEELEFIEGIERPVFGDNDKLSALVATKLGAGLLVLLTDVGGVFDRDPEDPQARLLEQVNDESKLAFVGGPGSAGSRGGMRSKVEAAAMAARAGCHAVIASGLHMDRLEQVLDGAAQGTWFPARGQLRARRRWIAFAAAPRGVLHLDAGAVLAVRTRGASLLAAGVERIDGTFRHGDVVELRDPQGTLVGRGMVYCDDETARAWSGGAPPGGIRNHDALVHRDHMVLEVPGGRRDD